MKFDAHAIVVGSKYLGVIEADDEEAALDKAQERHDGETITLCHECTEEAEELRITDIFVELVTRS